MGAREMQSTDDFLSHRSTERGGGFLDSWKKDPGWIEVWLHTQRKPIALWRHQFPIVSVKETDGEPTRKVFSGSYVCHEDERVLKKQYRRKDDGTREVPPRRCSLCRLIETVREMVEEGQLNWTQPLFRFEADDPQQTIVLHAGGIYNAYGGDLAEDQKKELAKASISPRVAWKENAHAKNNYLFCVVDNAHPEDGVKVAIEAGLLGDKVKDVINDSRDELGRDEGDPWITPYAFKWVFLKDEQEFSKKYKARRMSKLPLTPEISALIRDEPPDVSNYTHPFNQKTLRAFVEHHCLVKNMPWDDIFDTESADEEVADPEPAPEPSRAKAPAQPAAPRKPKAKEPPPPPPPDDDLVECDECHKAMKESEPKCPHCGAEYEVTPAEPPPPPVRKRGEAKGKSAPASNDDDQVPF